MHYHYVKFFLLIITNLLYFTVYMSSQSNAHYKWRKLQRVLYYIVEVDEVNWPPAAGFQFRMASDKRIMIPEWKIISS